MSITKPVIALRHRFNSCSYLPSSIRIFLSHRCGCTSLIPQYLLSISIKACLSFLSHPSFTILGEEDGAQWIDEWQKRPLRLFPILHFFSCIGRFAKLPFNCFSGLVLLNSKRVHLRVYVFIWNTHKHTSVCAAVSFFVVEPNCFCVLEDYCCLCMGSLSGEAAFCHRKPCKSTMYMAQL